MVFGQYFEYNTEIDLTLFPRRRIYRRQRMTMAPLYVMEYVRDSPQNEECSDEEEHEPQSTTQHILMMMLPELDYITYFYGKNEPTDRSITYNSGDEEDDINRKLSKVLKYEGYIRDFDILQSKSEDFKKTKKWRNRIIEVFDGITYRITKEINDESRVPEGINAGLEYKSKLLEMSYEALMLSSYIPLVFQVIRTLNHIRSWNSGLLEYHKRREILVENRKKNDDDKVLGMYVRLLGFKIPERSWEQQIDVELEEITLYCMSKHKTFPKQVLRVLITLLSKKYVRINESNAEIIASFLTGFSKYWSIFHPMNDLKFVDGMVECIYKIYYDLKDKAEIVNKITSTVFLKRLLKLWKKKAVLIMDQKLIVRILSIIAANSNEHTKTLLDKQIDVCISDLYNEYRGRDCPHYSDITLLLWALLPTVIKNNQTTVGKNIEEQKIYPPIKLRTWHKVIDKDTNFPLTPEVSKFLNESFDKKLECVNIIDDNKVCRVNMQDKYLINNATMKKENLIVKEISTHILRFRRRKPISRVEMPRDFVKFTYRYISARLKANCIKEEENCLMHALLHLSLTITRKQHNELFLKKYKKRTESRIQGNQDEVQGTSAVESKEPVIEKREVQKVKTEVEEDLEEEDENYLKDPIPFTPESLIEKIYIDQINLKVTAHRGSLIASALRLRFPTVYDHLINRLKKADQLSREFLNDNMPLTTSLTKSKNLGVYLIDFFQKKRKRFVDSCIANYMFDERELQEFLKMLDITITRKSNAFYNVFLDVEKIGGEEVISAEPFKKLVRKFMDMTNFYHETNADRYTWSKKTTTDQIFTTGVHTIKYISMQTIYIHFLDFEGRYIVGDEIYPFTLVDYLEHLLYETYYLNAKNEDYEYKEWHTTEYSVKLCLDDCELPSEITVYEAVRKYGMVEDEIFTTEYVMRLKKVENAEEAYFGEKQPLVYRTFFTDEVLNLHMNILNLLYQLNVMAPRWLLSEEQESLIAYEEFHFSNMEYYALKTLKDPLNALMGNFPGWINVVQFWPFLFTLETRKLALRVLGMDRIRAATTIFNGHPTFQRAFQIDSRYPLVQINKEHALDNMKYTLKWTRKFSDWNSYYDNQQAAGAGVKRDVYTTIAKQLMRADLNLWAVSKDQVCDSGFVSTKVGLYPEYKGGETGIEQDYFADCSQDVKFEFIGGIMAKAVLDQMILPIPMSRVLFKWLLKGEARLRVDDLKHVDTSFYAVLKGIEAKEYAKKISGNVDSIDDSSIASRIDGSIDSIFRAAEDYKWEPHLKNAILSKIGRDESSIEDLCLTFVLPRLDLELIPNGMETDVTDDNAALYMEKMTDAILKSGVRESMIAMRRGFRRIIKYKYLQMLRASELVDLVCGVQDSQFWTIEHLKANIETTKFSINSSEVLNSLQLMTEMTDYERRRFLQFVTGCPFLPFNGFAGLLPRFHIQCIGSSALPYVQTCFNVIYLPAGIDKEKLRKFFNLGITEGLFHFGLA